MKNIKIFRFVFYVFIVLGMVFFGRIGNNILNIHPAFGYGGGAVFIFPSTPTSNPPPISTPEIQSSQEITANQEKIVADILAKAQIEKIDFNNDGVINHFEFNSLMVNWGKKGNSQADFNNDKKVDLLDFNLIMIYWKL